LWRPKNPRLLAVQARLSQTTRLPSSENSGGEASFDRLSGTKKISKASSSCSCQPDDLAGMMEVIPAQPEKI